MRTSLEIWSVTHVTYQSDCGKCLKGKICLSICDCDTIHYEVSVGKGEGISCRSADHRVTVKANTISGYFTEIKIRADS